MSNFVNKYIAFTSARIPSNFINMCVIPFNFGDIRTMKEVSTLKGTFSITDEKQKVGITGKITEITINTNLGSELAREQKVSTDDIGKE